MMKVGGITQDHPGLLFLQKSLISDMVFVTFAKCSYTVQRIFRVTWWLERYDSQELEE